MPQEDRKRKEEVEARNNADSLAYQAEKTLRDLGDKVPADVRSEVEGKVAAVRSALQGQDVRAHAQHGAGAERVAAADRRSHVPAAAAGPH